MKDLETVYMANLEDWRRWLQDNHQTSPGVWLMFFKTSTGRDCITYDDALDEALCYGWIDSIIKKLDEERYLRKFTPRNNLTNWSPANKKRVLKLIDSGRMCEAGLAKIPVIQTLAEPAARPKPPSPQLTPELEQAIQANERAWMYWQTLSSSHRREYIWWLTSAKRPETVARRLAEALQMLERRELLGLR
jgi:uncharacterized protein YdeI (YjbR/CyaY-like superfamily)